MLLLRGSGNPWGSKRIQSAPKLLLRQLPPVELPAVVQERARPGRRLLVRKLEMLDDVCGEPGRQLRHGDERLTRLGDLQQSLAQREFVGGDVAAEQDDGPPVVVERRAYVGEGGHA